MWEHYWRTFGRIQIMIAGVSFLIFKMSHGSWSAVAAFFLMMQLGAIAGAAWGNRLRLKMATAAERLPLQGKLKL